MTNEASERRQFIEAAIDDESAAAPNVIYNIADFMIDGKLSMKALADKMRVTLIQFRKPEEVQAAMQQIQPLLQQHFAPGAPQQAGEPQQGPPLQ